jgi:hypothetical protein
MSMTFSRSFHLGPFIGWPSKRVSQALPRVFANRNVISYGDLGGGDGLQIAPTLIQQPQLVSPPKREQRKRA